MRLLPSFVALVLSLSVAQVLAHDLIGLSSRHHSHNPLARSIEARAPKRCPNRVFNQGTNAPGTNNVASTNSTKSASSPSGADGLGSSGSVITIQSACGPPRASTTVSKLTGPNGHIDYLNCGIDTPGGWNPPHVQIKDLIIQPLSTALQNPKSPFKACSKYLDLFERYGNQYGVPPIIMVSFSMQESGCNPNTVGGGGEQGMMQITQEKCVGAPGGNCKDPDFNIRTATKFFANTLAANGGNILLSIGNYNGWHLGLTIGEATAAAHSSCCRCQNNLDYVHQFVNGWVQNINSYGADLGKYFNLAVCGKVG